MLSIGSEWELFAFYKNLSLLACFAGLGLGYALARAPRLPLVLTVPLLAWQIGWLLFLRHGLSETKRIGLSRMPVQACAMGAQAKAAETIPTRNERNMQPSPMSVKLDF